MRFPPQQIFKASRDLTSVLLHLLVLLVLIVRRSWLDTQDRPCLLSEHLVSAREQHLDTTKYLLLEVSVV